MDRKTTAKELIFIYRSTKTKQEFLERAALVNGMDAEKLELAYHCINECYGILEIPEKTLQAACNEA